MPRVLSLCYSFGDFSICGAIMKNTLKPNPVWESAETLITVDSQMISESDIVHRFLRDVQSRHYSVAKIAFFEAPFHAIASFKQRSGANDIKVKHVKKIKRKPSKKLAPFSADAELHVYARRLSDHQFSLRYSVHQHTH